MKLAIYFVCWLALICAFRTDTPGYVECLVLAGTLFIILVWVTHYLYYCAIYVSDMRIQWMYRQDIERLTTYEGCLQWQLSEHLYWNSRGQM